ncbi:MAG TPA: hypothetical protein VHY58_08020 [Streptosporangiaceae bacterium]|jgi:hypothetical protein|nr:hypothetical protein [Streptosporangiaceae bacterium]
MPKFAGDPDVGDLAYVPGTASVWGAGIRALTAATQQGIIIADGDLPT